MENIFARAARFLKEQRLQKRWRKIISVLAAAVVFCTTYALILPAMTAERQTICGMEEHIHTEECFENGIQICGKEEHTHVDECFPKGKGITIGIIRQPTNENDGDTAASGKLDIDVQNVPGQEVADGQPAAEAKTREQLMQELEALVMTGNQAEDVVAAAKSFIGYEEDGRGFVSEVLAYAGIEGLPEVTDEQGGYVGYADWAKAVREAGLYADVSSVPKEGDLVFLDWEANPEVLGHEDERIDHAGIVINVRTKKETTETGETKKSVRDIMVLTSNTNGRIESFFYNMEDPANINMIAGYAKLPENPEQNVTESAGDSLTASADGAQNTEISAADDAGGPDDDGSAVQIPAEDDTEMPSNDSGEMESSGPAEPETAAAAVTETDAEKSAEDDRIVSSNDDNKSETTPGTEELASETAAESETNAAAEDSAETESMTGESEPAAETGAETEVGTEQSSETGTETEIGTEQLTETGVETEIGTEQLTETGAETEIGTEMSSEADTETDTELTSEADTETELSEEEGTETGTELSSETDTETETELSSETDTEIETEPSSENDTELTSETGTEAESETDWIWEEETEDETGDWIWEEETEEETGDWTWEDETEDETGDWTWEEETEEETGDWTWEDETEDETDGWDWTWEDEAESETDDWGWTWEDGTEDETDGWDWTWEDGTEDETDDWGWTWENEAEDETDDWGWTWEEETEEDGQIVEEETEPETEMIPEVSDPSADLETNEDWEASVADVELTGVWADDLAAVAKTQLGVKESVKNFETDEDGTRRGITRYGQWYGEPYGDDWSAMFVSFCLNYAEVPHESVPRSGKCGTLTEMLQVYGLYENPEEYEPTKGDLVFLDTDLDGTADRAGITEEVTEIGIGGINVIAGDLDGKVKNIAYAKDDKAVAGYGRLPQKPAKKLLHKIYEGEDVIITAEYTAEAMIPAEAQFVVEEIPEDDERYAQHFQTVQAMMDAGLDKPEAETAAAYSIEETALKTDKNDTKEPASGNNKETDMDAKDGADIGLTDKQAEGEAEGKELRVRVYNIGFYLDEYKEVEPQAEVKISIEFLNDPEFANGENTVIHMADEGPEALDVSNTEDEEDGKQKIEFATKRFSPFSVVANDGQGCICG